MLREKLERIEMDTLASYALKSSRSRGRRYPETKHPYRTEFQRDRDRIVHSTAFRRLQYKTQVFVNHEGDHYRTRLTHTMEVAIISRSIARALRLNEDLTEALALAHDLGHTPFGHSGEEALNEILSDKGGFEHNRQCLRVVDIVERRYPDFPGLNLTFELREGILKHHSNYNIPDIAPDLDIVSGPSLESQIVNIADEIAYNCHDVDDGLSSGILDEKKLGKLSVWKRGEDSYSQNRVNFDDRTRRHFIVRFLINYLITDLVENSQKAIVSDSPSSADDIRVNHKMLIQFSGPVKYENSELKQFLGENLYRNEKLLFMADEARKIVGILFAYYIENPRHLPPHILTGITPDFVDLVIADYIAGMTDRFAKAEYDKLIGR
ncbi:MAG: deoxyguanosinetriphosphate triphosphohydrolase [candidate division Zixibacteria bacterium]